VQGRLCQIRQIRHHPQRQHDPTRQLHAAAQLLNGV
jgi:hypothetical protein